MEKLIITFICLLSVIPCQAKAIYVDVDAAGNNDGSSWLNAYTNLQDALAAASSGDEIRAAEGIYKPDQGGRFVLGDQTAAFQLIDSVIIQGGYAGVGEPDPNTRNIGAYKTILSGDLNGDDGPGFTNNSDNSYHVVIGGVYPSYTEIRKGPYLIYPGDNTQMTVLWQLDDTWVCTLQWGLDTSYSTGSVHTNEYGDDHQHQYTITDLMPGAKYYYRLTVRSEQYCGSFRTAPPADANNVKFMAYGDTRSNPDVFDGVNAAMVDTFEADPNYQTLTLLTGDWVSNGDSELDWEVNFFSTLYLNTLELQANLPINGCKGNHEASGVVFNKYWPYPYVSNFYWSFDYGPAHFAVVDQYTNYSSGSPQLQWLEDDLATTTKKWKFIVLHEPGYSAGGGHGDNPAVQDYIQPLCEIYGVDIVFSGHSHYYARCDCNGVKHITTGGGGAGLHPPDPNFSEYVESCMRAHHFCRIDIQEDELAFEAVKPDGTIIDEFVLVHIAAPVLVGPSDGATVDANGAVLSCETVEGAVNYQLLFGAEANSIEYIVSDMAEPPGEVMNEFPYEDTYWTVRVRNESGATGTADARLIHGSVGVWNPRTLSVPQWFQTIQAGIDAAKEGDTVEVSAGTYSENISFKGLDITLASVDPNSSAATVINGGDQEPIVTFSSIEDVNCVLSGFTITGGNRGIYCSGASPTITDCTITGNSGSGIDIDYYSYPVIANCTISGNLQHGVSRGSPKINNCTIVGNLQSGVSRSYPVILNCIIRDNSVSAIDKQATITYSNIEGGWPGLGNIDTDPCFVQSGHWDDNSTPADANDDFWVDGDYHLKSKGWRWHTERKIWTWDNITSRCIDAGSPGSVLGEELLSVPDDPNNDWGKNLRINMGVFGGTEQASMPPYDWVVLADLTNHGKVDFADLEHWSDNWLSSDNQCPGDLSRNGFVNMVDFALFAQDWFAETSWYEP